MKLLLVCGIFTLANAVCIRQRVSPLPARLILGKPTPASTKLDTLDVALVSHDFAGLQQAIDDRADPKSPRYAQWLSTEEVTKFVSASDEAITTVAAWMRSAGLEPELNNHRDYLTARDVPAAKIKVLLGTALFTYYDAVTGRTVHRIPGNYSLPDHVAEHVMKVFPVHSIPASRIRVKGMRENLGNSTQAVEAAWPHDCKGVTKNGAITPAVTRALYNYTTKGGVTSSSIAAMLPGPVGVNIQALAYTQSACGIPDHPLDKFQGKNDRSCSGLHPSDDKCLEAAIDAQIISTTAIGCHTEFWNGGEGSFISMFKAINDAGDAAPRVFSFSFGDAETERDDDVQNTNKEFAKSVAKGITLVCSSGDNGAGHTLLGKYVTNFPASSPYVLSVGATSLITRASLTGGETAQNDGYSSGGYSSAFTASSWQSKFTQAYLKSGAKQPRSGFTKTGRGVPDISALGGGDDGWEIRYQGRFQDEAGTSTSGPFIASLVAKLNAARLSKGQSTMGHISPWLYTKAANAAGAFYDVTTGSNSADGQSKGGVWYATKGWDPVTGLGTPNYKVLEQLALEGEKQVIV